jgi:hypothetical protein
VSSLDRTRRVTGSNRLNGAKRDSLRRNARDGPIWKPVLQQCGDEIRDRPLTDNHALFGRAVPQRTNIQKQRTVADSRNRLAMSIGLTHEMDRTLRIKNWLKAPQ